jgi:hypothetical protein
MKVEMTKRVPLTAKDGRIMNPDVGDVVEVSEEVGLSLFRGEDAKRSTKVLTSIIRKKEAEKADKERRKAAKAEAEAKEAAEKAGKDKGAAPDNKNAGAAPENK